MGGTKLTRLSSFPSQLPRRPQHGHGRHFCSKLIWDGDGCETSVQGSRWDSGGEFGVAEHPGESSLFSLRLGFLFSTSSSLASFSSIRLVFEWFSPTCSLSSFRSSEEGAEVFSSWAVRTSMRGEFYCRPLLPDGLPLTHLFLFRFSLRGYLTKYE